MYSGTCRNVTGTTEIFRLRFKRRKAVKFSHWLQENKPGMPNHVLPVPVYLGLGDTPRQLEGALKFSSSHCNRTNAKVCLIHTTSSIFTATFTLLPAGLLLWYQPSKAHLFRSDTVSHRWNFYSFEVHTSSSDTFHHIYLLQKNVLPHAKH